jgi:Tfp pilus assembly protein PilO
MKIDKKRLVAVTTLVILTAVLYGLFLTPQVKRLKAVRSQYIAAKKLLKVRGIKEKKLDTLRSENRQWQKKLDAAESRFIPRDKTNLILEKLTGLAEKTNNELKTVDPLEGRSPAESGIEKMLVEVTVTGSYTSIMDFLKVLMDDKRLLDVTDIAIEKEEEGSEDLTASFVLTLFIIEGKS